MRKLIPFFLIIVFALVTGCSSDSAGEERGPRTSFVNDGETFVIYNKSDHEIVIEYEGGRRSVRNLPCSRYYKRQPYFFLLDGCTIDMGHPSRDLSWDYIDITYDYQEVRVYPDLRPCAHFNYPFIRDRIKLINKYDDKGYPVATSMRVIFDRGTPEERAITYTPDGLKLRDLRRNEQWVKEDSDQPGGKFSYTFTNADYDLARTIQESALEPIPAECLQQSNYDYD